MRFSAPITVHKACSLSEGRYALQGVQISALPDPERVRMVATDGRILAAVDVQAIHLGDEPDQLPAILPRDLLAKAKPLSRFQPFTLQVTNKATLRDKSGEKTVPLVEGTFPTYDAILDRKGDKFKYNCKFSINAELLHNLSIALSATDGAVVLEIPDNDFAPVRVSVAGNDNVIGAIMRVN